MATASRVYPPRRQVVRPLLREPPSTELGSCLEQEPTITPEIPDLEVAEKLASYKVPMKVRITSESQHTERFKKARR